MLRWLPVGGSLRVLWLKAVHILGPLAPSRINHLLNLWRSVDRDNLDVGMSLRKHSKDLVCKRLANSLHCLKVKKNGFEAIYSGQQAFGLGPRNDLGISLRKHSKDLVCKRLANSLHCLKVKKNGFEAIYSGQQAFGLGPRNEFVVAILGQPDRNDGLGKT